MILRRLSERYGELEIETNIRALIELMTFQQGPHEDVDQALTRFDIPYSRATTHAAVQMSPALLAYILLSVLRVSLRRWPVLFMPWGGAFPTSDDQYRALKSGLRQQGHLLENHHSSFHNMGRQQSAPLEQFVCDGIHKHCTIGGDLLRRRAEVPQM